MEDKYKKPLISLKVPFGVIISLYFFYGLLTD